MRLQVPLAPRRPFPDQSTLDQARVLPSAPTLELTAFGTFRRQEASSPLLTSARNQVRLAVSRPERAGARVSTNFRRNAPSAPASVQQEISLPELSLPCTMPLRANIQLASSRKDTVRHPLRRAHASAVLCPTADHHERALVHL